MTLNRNTLDNKQSRLITAWLERATAADGDEYGRFMAAWLAFNAFCYARFASLASRKRPDLRDGRGLAGLAGRVDARGTLELRSDGRIRLQIETPGRIRIDIRDRYTEDIVSDQFARSYRAGFRLWVKDSFFESIRDDFLSAIRRAQGTYVVNMLRAADYSPEHPLGELVDRNIVVEVRSPDELGEIVKALYQVRCNVFHGEKVPGEINDDRIVRAARPLVVELLHRAMSPSAKPIAEDVAMNVKDPLPDETSSNGSPNS